MCVEFWLRGTLLNKTWLLLLFALSNRGTFPHFSLIMLMLKSSHTVLLVTPYWRPTQCSGICIRGETPCLVGSVLGNSMPAIWADVSPIMYFWHVVLLASNLQSMYCLTNLSFRQPPGIGRNKYRQLARMVHTLYSLHLGPGHPLVALYKDIPHI